MLHLTKLALSVAAVWSVGGLAACAHTPSSAAATTKHTTNHAVLHTYSHLAAQGYAQSLADARLLQVAVDAFVTSPTAANLAAAKQAWLHSRESYGTTEIFRLSQGPIDAEEGWVADHYGNLEGQINAWPLDEHMIDYTIDEHGHRTHGNIIDSTGLFTPGGEQATAVDITIITPEVLTELNENGGEANVATGYHAIEFLLWGQDQDYDHFIEDKITHGAMVAGQRPLSDFTTDRHAPRRLAYLKAATDKLVADLETVNSAWTDKGMYRQALLGKLTGSQSDHNIEPQAALKAIFIGMGMFIKSELANERIAVAVLTPSEEDEHSCFSDNTHRDIAQNFQGFKDVLMGTLNGKKIGAAPFDALSAEEKMHINQLIARIDQRIAKIDATARTSMHFDYQIQPQNTAEVQNIVSLKNDLRRLGDTMVAVAAAHDIGLSTTDVTDEEETQI